MKQNEYIPQFEDVDINETKISTKTNKCKICNKESISLHKGICFDCREKSKNNISLSNIIACPDWDLFCNYNESVRKKSTLPIGVGLLWLLLGKPLLKYGYSGLIILYGIVELGFSIFFLSFEQLLLSIILLTLGFLLYKRKIKKDFKKFEKYNNAFVFVYNSTHWDCPCCKAQNTKLVHCKQCGVLPIFKEKNKI